MTHSLYYTLSLNIQVHSLGKPASPTSAEEHHDDRWLKWTIALMIAFAERI